jgi:hypothetical protein
MNSRQAIAVATKRLVATAPRQRNRRVGMDGWGSMSPYRQDSGRGCRVIGLWSRRVLSLIEGPDVFRNGKDIRAFAALQDPP